jgi:hypothetical protein
MDGHHKEHDVELREMPGSPSTIDRDDAALGRLGKKSVLKVRSLHDHLLIERFADRDAETLCVPFHPRI